jgi:transposase InsO family protein
LIHISSFLISYDEFVTSVTRQVWSCDITYIRLIGGFVYLMAMIDWFSRFVLGLGTLKPTGHPLLSGGVGSSTPNGETRHFHYRSRGPVYKHRLDFSPAIGADS